MAAEPLARHSEARFTSSHLLFQLAPKHATAIGRAGQRDEKRGPAELGRGGLHKGKALAESCKDADNRRFVQEKMNKVKKEVRPTLLVWES